jgi:uncharacterized protein (DUF58 family)
VPRTEHRTQAQREAAQVAARLGRVRLLTSRMVRGIGAGAHNAAAFGAGWERAEPTEYHPGDDVRHIDWAASARSTSLVLRMTHAEREARVAVVLDGAPSMAFGTDTHTKHETGAAIAAAILHVVVEQGDTAVLVHATAPRPAWHPISAVRGAAAPALRRLVLDHPDLARAGSVPSTVPDVLRGLGTNLGRNDLTVLISDLHADGWQQPVRALAATRPVLVVQPFDRRERELPPVGELTMTVAGTALELDTRDPAVRERYRAIAAELAARRRAAVLDAGALHLEVAADAELGRDVLDVLRLLTSGRPATSSHTGRIAHAAVR